jgi:ParB-like chromosome segregation protein Spo0J
MTTLEFHPLADIFPLVEGQDFAELVADIREHGLHEPIVVFEAKILDGRNRYRACVAAGVEPTFTVYTGDDPVAYVISLNLRRRHLDESQRAMVAAKLATLRLGDNQHSEGLPIGRSSELLNVGERSVARAREVQERGAPELVHAVEQGAVSVSAAADIATQPIEEQREIVARGEREILRAAQEIRARKAEMRRAERMADLTKISGTSPLRQDRKYPIIYADPAWKFHLYDPDATRVAERHYPTMATESICALPVGNHTRRRVVPVGTGTPLDRRPQRNDGVGLRVRHKHGLGERQDRSWPLGSESPRTVAHRPTWRVSDS